jgi:signal transduction histidine kinase
MTVRLRLALTIFVIGVCTALGVLVTVAMAFQRFEHESTYERANAFVGRVVDRHPDLLDLQMRDPDGFTGFLRNLLLFEPDSQLYLLDAQGDVLAASGSMQPKPGFKVRLEPVREAVAIAGDRQRAPYVMGDDPEHMNLDAVIAARPLLRTVIRPEAGTAGYLYLVCQPPGLNVGHVEVYRSSLMGTSLLGLTCLIVLMTALAAWIVATVTRPLRDLSDAVARAQREGFDGAVAVEATAVAPSGRAGDEFAQLRAGFHAMLTRLRSQWDALRRLDQFRRESVSNLSHDLRSPLTATVACLETLDRRWGADAARADDRAMLEVALRNTRNAAQLVRSLGDLALLDEPEFKLQPMTMNLGEMLDDIVMRFADRAAQQGVTLRNDSADAGFAAVDVELFERAVANLVDNALKHTPAGGAVTLRTQADDDQARVVVADTGSGIAADDLEHLFDRLYTGSGARGDADGGGKGLGLAIVKRIVELHRGEVSVRSSPGQGTEVTIRLPRDSGV